MTREVCEHNMLTDPCPACKPKELKPFKCDCGEETFDAMGHRCSPRKLKEEIERRDEEIKKLKSGYEAIDDLRQQTLGNVEYLKEQIESQRALIQKLVGYLENLQAYYNEWPETDKRPELRVKEALAQYREATKEN